MSKQTILLFAAFAFAIAAVDSTGRAAQAFTTGSQSSSSSAQSSQFTDPDEQVVHFGGAPGEAQFASGPSYRAGDYRPGQKPDLSGPLFRSLQKPIVGDGGYR
jgi:hypothetical protein